MARNFTVAQSQLYSASAAGLPVTSTGTISLWYKPSSFTGGAVMLYNGGTASPLRMQPAIQARYTDNQFYVGFYNAGADQRIIGGAAGYTDGVWHNVVFDYDGAVPSQRYYVNNTLIGSSAAGFTGFASGVAGLAIGNSTDNVGSDYYARGDIAEVARWDRRLTDDERTLLYQGYSPATIPSGLLRYYRLLGTSSPEPEYFGVNEPLTVTGATASAHPRIHMPSSPARGWTGWRPITQRTPRVRLNQSHRLARGLRAVFPCTEGRGAPNDLVRHRVAVTSATWTHSTYGPDAGTTGSVTNASTADMAFTSGSFTVAAFFRIFAVPIGGQHATIFGRFDYGNESSNTGWALSLNGDSSRITFACFQNGNQFGYNLAGTTPLAIGEWLAVGASNGTTRRIYVNGAQENSTTTQPNGFATTGLCYLPSQGGGLFLRAHWAAAWLRELSAAEIRHLWYKRQSVGGLLVQGPVPANMPGVLTSTVSPRIRPFGRRKPL